MSNLSTITIPKKPLISRKDIAAMIGCCTRYVANHESEWGLDKAKANTGTERILFRTVKVVEILTVRGII